MIATYNIFKVIQVCNIQFKSLKRSTMLNFEQKNYFNEILESLGRALDISKSQYEEIVRSYRSVGKLLSQEDSVLAPYEPEILPQGSMLIGTLTKNINKKDDIDVDLVCQLKGKQESWTQKDLKQKVGDQIKQNKTYESMLVIPDGRRCWTLNYSDSANYHMDILPSIVDSGYRLILEKAFSAHEFEQVDELAIRITDKKRDDYTVDTNHLNWLKSNPFGYARWFFAQAITSAGDIRVFKESVQPLPTYTEKKLPLQRAIQILKRHRDIMFDGDENKPISIIITTLAAKAYNKETNILEALLNIVNRMPQFIEERYSPELDRHIKWIPNPVNEEENFADKWVEKSIKENNFYLWYDEVQKDLQNMIQQSGYKSIRESLENPFGKDTVIKAFENLGVISKLQRERGDLKVNPATGFLGTVGTLVKQHTFDGK